MKAKEYAARYRQGTDIAEIALDFITEVKRIGEARGAQSNESMFAIFNEQDAKWRAMARMADGEKSINPDGFKEALKHCVPSAFFAWQWMKEVRQ